MANGKSVAIVGSGVAATAIAHTLTGKGHKVTIFEKGPAFPYPHTPQFEDRIQNLYRNPIYELPPDIKRVTVSGGYPGNLDAERGMVVGGSATHWTAIALRMHPQDFRTRTQFGFGTDWPIGYDDIEPYYCRAEAFLGVSGTDADNPYAPRRSKPFPLPPFSLGWADRAFAAGLQERGIVLHTTPQARARMPYDGRPACVNFGTCEVCPIGARYSPNHHLARLVENGSCRVLPNVSVRRLLTDSSGRASTIVYREHGTDTDKEYAADLIVVAAGALESARLLLLSKVARHPDGIGNAGGHAGKNLAFHHLWIGALRYRHPVHAGDVGPLTGQSHHFLNPPGRGRQGGGIKVEFSSSYAGEFRLPQEPASGAQVREALRNLPNSRGIILHAESDTGANKYLRLSDDRDRFGDPFAHVHYESSDFDRATHRLAGAIFEKFRDATGAEAGHFDPVEQFDSGAHHMGTCRMGSASGDSVVDSFGRVHGVADLYLAGSSIFCGTSGAMNPTLTLVALALRTADHIAGELAARKGSKAASAFNRAERGAGRRSARRQRSET